MGRSPNTRSSWISSSIGVISFYDPASPISKNASIGQGRPLSTLLKLKSDHPDESSQQLAERLNQQTHLTYHKAAVRKLLHEARHEFSTILIRRVAESLGHPGRRRDRGGARSSSDCSSSCRKANSIASVPRNPCDRLIRDVALTDRARLSGRRVPGYGLGRIRLLCDKQRRSAPHGAACGRVLAAYRLASSRPARHHRISTTIQWRSLPGIIPAGSLRGSFPGAGAQERPRSDAPSVQPSSQAPCVAGSAVRRHAHGLGQGADEPAPAANVQLDDPAAMLDEALRLEGTRLGRGDRDLRESRPASGPAVPSSGTAFGSARPTSASTDATRTPASVRSCSVCRRNRPSISSRRSWNGSISISRPVPLPPLVRLGLDNMEVALRASPCS